MCSYLPKVLWNQIMVNKGSRSMSCTQLCQVSICVLSSIVRKKANSNRPSDCVSKLLNSVGFGRENTILTEFPYLTFFDMMLKCLYLLNAMAQFYYMHRFIGAPIDSMWPIKVVIEIYETGNYKDIPYFPKV